MSDEKDPYEVLGLTSKASQDEIKKAYKRLARKNHPDVNPGDSAAENRFKEISAAYELLEDPDKRKLFDEFGHQAASPGFDPEKARAYRAWQEQQATTGGSPFGAGGPEDFEFDLGEMFGDLFGRGARRGGGGFRGQDIRVPRRGPDIRTEMTVDFLDAVKGTETAFSMTTGGSEESTKTSVRIPPGVKDGQTLRLRGRGAPGSDGGPSGDLLIEIRVKPHSLLQRDGTDLLLKVPVTIKEAMVGGRIEVPTLEGPVKLTVPGGSQSGTKLRLKGKGGWAPDGKTRGDLMVTLDVRLPPAPAEDTTARAAVDTLEERYEEPVRSGLRI